MKLAGTIISSIATAALASTAVFIMTSNKPAVRKIRKQAVKNTKHMIKNGVVM